MEGKASLIYSKKRGYIDVYLYRTGCRNRFGMPAAYNLNSSDISKTNPASLCTYPDYSGPEREACAINRTSRRRRNPCGSPDVFESFQAIYGQKNKAALMCCFVNSVYQYVLLTCTRRLLFCRFSMRRICPARLPAEVRPNP